MMKKVMVVILDGCDWKIIRPFCKEGFLPTLQKIIKDGVHGSLRSCFPPITWPAAESICTGKKPDSHGYYESMELDKNYNLIILKRRTNKKIWNFLNLRATILARQRISIIKNIMRRVIFA